MSRGSSPSSQVGLFSTQISEQIVRLRALTRNQDGPSEAHQVDLRRAVMATRLLAGSARILRLESLQRFLDELLEWLQTVERSGRALSTTQALILDSVVEIEESLMLHIDESEAELGADLGPFQSQIDDLLTLIRHNTEKSTPDEEADEANDLSVQQLEASTGGGASAAAAPNGPEALEFAARWYEEALGAAADDEERTAALLTRLEGPLERLIALRAEALDRARAERESDPGPLAEGLDPLDDPDADPLLGPAVVRLREASDALGVTPHVHAFGGAAVVAAGLHRPVSTILVHLVDDIVASLRAGRDEDDRSPVGVTFVVRADEGRALVTVADDAPRVQGSPVLGDADDLALFGGLRRARHLLEQSQGLIRVETGEDSRERFVLSVPLDLDRPSYAVLTLESAQVAVPSALVDEVIEAGGLLYDTDESGESVEVDGRAVPLADLAQFVGDLVPAAGPSSHIAVIGSVEKRMGLPCEAERTVVRAESLLDAPSGWEPVAYGALDVEGTVLPVLDVKRLLALRFRLAGDPEFSGAMMDPLVDSYVPADEDDLRDLEPAPAAAPERAAEPATAPAAEPAVDRGSSTPASRPRRLEKVLLVNQSEFRRRDLGRTLEQLGLQVTVSEDLPTAAQRIDDEGVDLLVTDLRLGQEGGESFHTLRAKHPELRILLTSSVAAQYAGELADKTGAHSCWLDPYRSSDLRDLLGRLQD